MIITVLFAAILPTYAFAENCVKQDIQWKYDNDKIWANDPLHNWNGTASITSGVVECPDVRFISGVIPANGILSFSWMKTTDGDFSFIRINGTPHEEFCRDYDNLGSFRSYSVKKGEIAKWTFKLPSPPCRAGQCWLRINYSPDISRIDATLKMPNESIKFDIISTPYICRYKNFLAYIVVESPIEIEATNFTLNCSEGLQIVDCLGEEGFFRGLEKTSNESYKSSVSIPQKKGKLVVVYTASSIINKNNFFICVPKMELIAAEKVISVDPKNITIEIPDKFNDIFAEEYEHAYPDHHENIDCLWDCVIDGN